MIVGYGSIDGVIADADALDFGDGVFGVGSLTLVPVVGLVSSAVGVVPGVVGHNGVPEGVGGGSVGQEVSHETGSEVGLEEAFAEVDPDEVLALVVVFEIEALEIAVVPGVVGVGDSGLDEGLLGGVPEFVVSDQRGRGACQEGNQQDKGLHKYDMFIFTIALPPISTYPPNLTSFPPPKHKKYSQPNNHLFNSKKGKPVDGSYPSRCQGSRQAGDHGKGENVFFQMIVCKTGGKLSVGGSGMGLKFYF